VLETGFVDDDFLEYARGDAEALDPDFLFLGRVHRVDDNEKLIGVARVLLGGQSLLVPDDALEIRRRRCGVIGPARLEGDRELDVFAAVAAMKSPGLRRDGVAQRPLLLLAEWDAA